MKIGQKVILDNLAKLDVQFCQTYNPIETIGVVVSVGHASNMVEVRWKNGIRNSYYPSNLTIIGRNLNFNLN